MSILNEAYTATASLGLLVANARTLLLVILSAGLIVLAAYRTIVSFHIEDDVDRLRQRRETLHLLLGISFLIALTLLNLYFTRRYKLYAAGQGMLAVM